MLSVLYSYPLVETDRPTTWIPIGCVGLAILTAVGTVWRAQPGKHVEESELEGCVQSLGCLPLIVLAALATTHLVNHGIRAVTAGGSHWESTKAVVESWNLDEKESGYSMEYTSWITYFYVVDDQPYRGRAASVNSRMVDWSQFDENAYAALKRYPTGGTFDIYVNRSNPSDSIFLIGHSRMTAVFLPLVSLALLVVIVYLRLRNGGIAGVFWVLLILAASVGLTLVFRSVPEPSEPVDRTVAGIEIFQNQILKKRAAWDALTPESPESSLAELGNPTKVFISDDGTETMVFPMAPGLEMDGEVVLRPTDEGLRIQKVSKPFMTKTSQVAGSWSAPE